MISMLRIYGMDPVLRVFNGSFTGKQYHLTKLLTVQLHTYLSCECNYYKHFTELHVQAVEKPNARNLAFGWVFYATCTVHVAQTRRLHEQIEPARSALYHGIPGNGCFFHPF